MSGLRNLKELSLNVANVARHRESDRVESHDEPQSMSSRRKLNLSQMTVDRLELIYDVNLNNGDDDGEIDDDNDDDNDNERRQVIVDFLDGLSRIQVKELKIGFSILQYVPLETFMSWGMTLQKATVLMARPGLTLDDVQTQQALGWATQYWTELESLELYGRTNDLGTMGKRQNTRTKFPSDATFSNLMKLTSLNVYDMSQIPLSTIPPGLKQLCLSNCDIPAIPANTCLYFPNLQTLALSNVALPPPNGYQWDCQRLHQLTTYFGNGPKTETQTTYRSQMLAIIHLVFGARALIEWHGHHDLPPDYRVEDKEDLAHAARDLVHRIECGQLSLQLMDRMVIDAFCRMLTQREVAALRVSLVWNRGKDKVVDLPIALWPYALAPGVATRPFRFDFWTLTWMYSYQGENVLQEDRDAQYQLLRRVMTTLGDVSAASSEHRSSSMERCGPTFTFCRLLRCLCNPCPKKNDETDD